MLKLTGVARTNLRRARDVASYLEMAASCRRMAAGSRRPGPLLVRAEYYDRAAADLKRREFVRLPNFRARRTLRSIT